MVSHQIQQDQHVTDLTMIGSSLDCAILSQTAICAKSQRTTGNLDENNI